MLMNNSVVPRRPRRSQFAIITNGMLNDIAILDGLASNVSTQARRLTNPQVKRKGLFRKVVRVASGLKSLTEQNGVSRKTKVKARNMLRLILKRARDDSDRQWVEAAVTRRQLNSSLSKRQSRRVSLTRNNTRRRTDQLPRTHRAFLLSPSGGKKIGSHRSTS